MSHRDIVAIGASAGGVDALLALAKGFSPGFPAAVLITLHIPSRSQPIFDQLLTRTGPLPASFASDGDVLRKGRIYVAPPDRHLLLENDRLLLGDGPRENHSRPAVDPMLRSVAVCCGPRAIGVVLTGTLGDGASGLWAIQQCGGLTVVQDPRDAAFPEMPQSALSRVEVDRVARLSEMPALLDELARQPAGRSVRVPEAIKFELQIAKGRRATMDDMDRIGQRSVLACPDCHGVMWEIDEGKLTRYRCHVGHTYNAELMSLALDESLRRALESALRALEERLALARSLQRQAAEGGRAYSAESWAARAHEFERELEVIRNSIRRTQDIARLAAE